MYVELKKVHKSFGSAKVSDDISFGIEKGKLIGLLGPSGSGKTTVLRMIAGLEKPDSGEICIDGKRVNEVSANQRGIGFVFQSYALFRYMTVFENIAFGLEIQGWKKNQIRERVEELLELTGLVGLERRFPSQLSGGQKQRVAFARALAPSPHLLLLDEPFAAVDAKVRQELRSWLREIIDRVGITSIFVTHDQEEAIEVSDEIIVMNQGKIEQMGTPPNLYREPATAFVATFLGESLELQDVSQVKGFGSKEQEIKQKGILRPEYIQVYKKGELQNYFSVANQGIVQETFFRGSFVTLEIQIGEMVLIARRNLNDATIHKGEEVDVLITSLYIQDKEGIHLVENAGMAGIHDIYI